MLLKIDLRSFDNVAPDPALHSTTSSTSTTVIQRLVPLLTVWMQRVNISRNELFWVLWDKTFISKNVSHFTIAHTTVACLTKLQQMFAVIVAAACIVNVLDINLSFMTESIDIRGSTVPGDVCNTTTGLTIPATYVQHSALLATTTWKTFQHS